MSANPESVAPTGRKTKAQGKERSDAALGHESEDTSSPEGAKEGGEYPAGWRRATLGDILPLKYGKARSEQFGYPRPDTQTFGSNGAFGTFERALTTKPTLVVGRKGAAGAVHYSPNPCWPIDTAFYTEGSEGAFLAFFRYLLESLQLVRLDRSTAIPSLSRDDYSARVVHFPESLLEQRRIVAEIEKQFTRLEAGVAALRRVQANLKRYRAAVLKASIGADDSPRISLVDLVERGAKVLYGILQPGPEIHDGIPYVRPTEIHLDKIQLGEIRKTSREIAAKYTRSILRTGDIILSIVGTIGKVATVPAELDGGNITQSSVRIRPDSTKVRGDYLAWVLRSPFAVRQYDAARLGTAVPRLNVAHVRDLLIPAPPLAEQTRIVAEVERRLSVVEELEAVVSANLQRAGRLRQSILQKAFTGQLVARVG